MLSYFVPGRHRGSHFGLFMDVYSLCIPGDAGKASRD